MVNNKKIQKVNASDNFKWKFLQPPLNPPSPINFGEKIVKFQRKVNNYHPATGLPGPRFILNQPKHVSDEEVGYKQYMFVYVPADNSIDPRVPSFYESPKLVGMTVPKNYVFHAP